MLSKVLTRDMLAVRQIDKDQGPNTIVEFSLIINLKYQYEQSSNPLLVALNGHLFQKLR